ETAEVLAAIKDDQRSVLALIGNSGVGKSSLMQAGVIASLKRQLWPGTSIGWPKALEDSRVWAYLMIRPGDDPILALTSAFVALWSMEATDPERIQLRNRWKERLAEASAGLSDLIDVTVNRYTAELKADPPRRIFLYVDQGEELFSRND